MKSGPLFAEILVVDDDPVFVKRVRLVLQSAGYVVRSAGSGEAALEGVHSRPPDLILMDVRLPGIDGYETVRRLRTGAGLPFVPVLMSTGDGQQDLASGLNAGADEFIGKPFSNAELLARVRALLRLKTATDALAELNATLEQKVIARTRELEQAHAQLRHAEKLASLGRLSATLAHEINNPLTGILSYLYLLKQGLPAGSELQGDVQLIERQVDAIARLVQQLRDFAKPPHRERCPVALNRVLEDVLALMGKELERHRVQVVRAFDPALPPALASAEQMGQIFMNLILNAQDAMPGGGTLTLRTGVDGAWVQAQVVDTGAGIPAELLERIFEPFFTTKGERGTGLGLSVCHSIVHEHGGELDIESQVGQGTTFSVRLPVYQEQ